MFGRRRVVEGTSTSEGGGAHEGIRFHERCVEFKGLEGNINRWDDRGHLRRPNARTVRRRVHAGPAASTGVPTATAFPQKAGTVGEKRGSVFDNWVSNSSWRSHRYAAAGDEAQHTTHGVEERADRRKQATRKSLGRCRQKLEMKANAVEALQEASGSTPGQAQRLLDSGMPQPVAEKCRDAERQIYRTRHREASELAPKRGKKEGNQNSGRDEGCTMGSMSATTYRARGLLGLHLAAAARAMAGSQQRCCLIEPKPNGLSTCERAGLLCPVTRGRLASELRPTPLEWRSDPSHWPTSRVSIGGH